VVATSGSVFAVVFGFSKILPIIHQTNNAMKNVPKSSPARNGLGVLRK